jgi:acyl carrier protein
MMKKEIGQLIRNFIVEGFLFGESNNLSDSDSLLEKGIIDSTGVLELVAFIEETYGFKLKDEELIPDNLDSIVNIVEFVSRRQPHV